MKSYTDLEQSKKLAEILPLESADYHYITQGEKSYFYPYSLSSDAIKDYDEEIKYIPCWSLAALIGVLPQFIEFKGDKYYLRFMKEYVEYANDEVSITSRYLHTTGNNNLVDACCEMIIKLKEQNLL